MSIKSRHPRRIVWACTHLFCVMLLLVLILLPFVVCIFTAFKAKEEYTLSSAVAPPINWLYFENFVIVWRKNNMARAMINSLLLTSCTVAITTVETSMMGFVLQRRLIRGSRVILMLYMTASLIPSIALQVGAYRIMSFLRLINSFTGYIIISSEVDIISIAIIMQQISAIDRDIDAAARMDGCGLTRLVFYIIIPIIRPGVLTVATLKFIYMYNEYYNASIYLQDKSRLMTVTTLLHSFMGPYGNQYHLICAGVIISVIPILLLFLLTQKNLYRFIAI